MAKNKKKLQEPAQKNTPILGYLIVFIIGFVCGIAFAAFKLDQAGPVAEQPVQQQNEMASAIASLEAEVTAKPDNYQAWVQLGHMYYDTNQYPKAISAYTTSLKYHDGTADLLTDLGVMYRRTGESQKAVDWFKKAQAMDPQHLPSRLNEGIVKHFDLDDTPGAVKAWEGLLALNPEMRLNNGEKLSDFIDGIKKQSAQ